MVDEGKTRAAQQLIRAIVARGKTVVVPDPKKTAPTGWDKEAKETVMRAVVVEYSEDQEVELPADEVTRLRTLGFLVDPTRKLTPQVATGPTFSEEKASEGARILG